MNKKVSKIQPPVYVVYMMKYHDQTLIGMFDKNVVIDELGFFSFKSLKAKHLFRIMNVGISGGDIELETYVEYGNGEVGISMGGLIAVSRPLEPILKTYNQHVRRIEWVWKNPIKAQEVMNSTIEGIKSKIQKNPNENITQEQVQKEIIKNIDSAVVAIVEVPPDSKIEDKVDDKKDTNIVSMDLWKKKNLLTDK